MQIGTKSVLFGAHCFVFHWLYVAEGWRRLYGFPFDPRLWVAFVVHDLGYIGKPNMDGDEGERHVYLGATIMGQVFDDTRLGTVLDALFGTVRQHNAQSWWGFSAYHSRFIAKQNSMPPSRLCIADKLAITLVPWWIYLPMTRATGELAEYMRGALDKQGKYRDEDRKADTPRIWYADMCQYVRRWVEAHKDGAEDTWTPTPAA